MAGETNIDRLLKHLKPGSLAERLAKAARDAEAGNSAEAMANVIKSRLEEVRSEIGGAPD
jgi:hypothetical protein